MGSLTRPFTGSEIVVVIEGRFSTPSTAMQTKTATKQKVATVFMAISVMLYGISKILIIENAPQFVSKLFTSTFFYLGRKLLTNTSYHHQTNRKTGISIKMTVTLPRLYVNWHQCS